MCRWFAYTGEESVLLSDVLITPKHSITKQIDSHFLPNVHIEFKATDSGKLVLLKLPAVKELT